MRTHERYKFPTKPWLLIEKSQTAMHHHLHFLNYPRSPPKIHGGVHEQWRVLSSRWLRGGVITSSRSAGDRRYRPSLCPETNCTRFWEGILLSPPLRGSPPPPPSTFAFAVQNMCYDFDMVGGPVFCHVSKSRSHRIRSSDVYPRKRSLGRRHDYLIVFILMGSGRFRPCSRGRGYRSSQRPPLILGGDEEGAKKKHQFYSIYWGGWTRGKLISSSPSGLTSAFFLARLARLILLLIGKIVESQWGMSYLIFL